MEIIGYISAVFTGILLGLLGGGGSILAVPIFVYLFGVPADTSTSYSLLVVMFGAIFSFFKKRRGMDLELSDAAVLAVTSSIGVLISRSLILPAVPTEFELFGIEASRNITILIVFVALTLAAGFKMVGVFGSAKKEGKGNSDENSKGKAAISGFLIGILTAFVGAGGGFLIVPTLNLALGIEIKKAIVLSLGVIALNSAVGVATDITAGRAYEWSLLLPFIAIMFGGVFLGDMLSNRIESRKLKRAFGWFVIALSIFIIVKETL